MDHQRVLTARFGKRRPRAVSRRADFKGERKRLYLRLPPDVVLGLSLIKIASGTDKNRFAEDALTLAVGQRVNELRAQHGEQAWQALMRSAAGITS